MSESLNELLRDLNVTKENIKRYGYRVITRGKEADIFLNKILKRETRRALEINISVYKGCTSTTTTISTISRSSIIKFMERYDTESIRIRNENNKTIVGKKFTYQYISIKADQADMCYDIMNNDIYVVISKNGRVNAYSKIYNNCYKCITTNLNISGTIEEIAAKSNGTVYKYMPLFPTAAGNKNFSTVCILLDDFITEELIEMQYDKETCGGYSLFKEKIDEMKLNGVSLEEIQNKILKGEVRFSAKQSSSISLGTITGMQLYDGEWNSKCMDLLYHEDVVLQQNKLQTDLLTGTIDLLTFKRYMAAFERNIPRKVHYVRGKVQDGQAYMSALRLASMIFIKFGVLIDPDLLVGYVFQARPATAKVSVYVISHRTFTQMLKGSIELGYNKDINPGKPVENIIYGDTNKITMLIDRNGLKLPIKEGMFKNVDFEVLATAKISESCTNKQLLRQGFYLANDKEYLKTLCVDTFREAFREMHFNAYDMHNDSKYTLAEVSKTLNSNYFTLLEIEFNPGILDESKSFYKTTRRQQLSSMVNMTGRINVPLNSENRRMVADATFIITGGRVSGVLAERQCFINNKDRHDVVMLKYPVQGLREYYCLNNAYASVSSAVSELYESGKVTKEEAWCINDFFIHVSEKVIILPASLHIMHVCAGSDYDYDGAAILYRVESCTSKKDSLSNYLMDLFEENFTGIGVNII